MSSEVTQKVANAEPIALGALRGAYGLKGWVRVQPFQDGDALLSCRKWVLMTREGAFRELAVEASKVHGAGIVAKFAGIASPEEADALRGAVGLYRKDFPELEDGEFYWVDLIGCRVINTHEECIGEVSAMDTNGVQDILDVRGEHGRFLIPFIEAYVLGVDMAERTIRVEWEKDWK